MPRPKRYWPMIEASRSEACLAARLCNDPSEARAFEGFVVHMHLAYLYLLHAIFTRDGVDFRYWRRDRPNRLEKIDGEPKRWELARYVVERWPSVDPVRSNIEFFVGLRNKIEHRYASQSQLSLQAALGGLAQAHLLNYEEELVAQFGQEVTLATKLRFPVFIGTFTDSGEATLLRLRSALPAPLRTFISEYHSGLSDEITSDRRYELRLRLVNELVARDPDALALQFTRFDDLTEEQKDAVEALGRKGLVIIREQRRGVVNPELMKPNRVISAVAAALPFVFHRGHFIRSWQKLGVRPTVGSIHPERTDERYCLYDEMHGDYGYTKAFVNKLTKLLATDEGWREFFGEDPRVKESSEVLEDLAAG
ncbi:DUF3644 domain-containing protein [Kutzneria albida]|uniref:DUF3644 domain-containing protein n=1 Tax=Kutzneria albida DSM 43870 TaxID=1449976 RepID=W5WA04_9PSEU|nr:DUF3644 domain-containing protein [Kutzneria albida]AHH97590.1 hypothetical protein KALB_4227 [Kutzneria albida DSM 43870]